MGLRKLVVPYLCTNHEWATVSSTLVSTNHNRGVCTECPLSITRYDSSATSLWRFSYLIREKFRYTLSW